MDLADELEECVRLVSDSYYRLVLLVGPAGSGKTAAVMELSRRQDWRRINLNLDLAEKLLDVSTLQRAVRIAPIFGDIIRGARLQTVILDNIELLFSTDLQLDPLRLLQSVSRNCTVVAAWPGKLENGVLTYAEPGHPEWRRYPNPQATIVRVHSGGAENRDTESTGTQ